MAETLIQTWKKRGYAPWTVWCYRAILQRILGNLVAFGAPFIRLPRMRKPQPRGVTATPQEITQLLRKARPHLQLLILLCWQTALRSGEAYAACPEGWNVERGTLTVVTKGNRLRTIPVTPDITVWLQIAAPKSATIREPFIQTLNGKPITRSGLEQQWLALKKECGVNADLHLHDLRRTTATNLYRETTDLRAVQQYLGHDSLTSTIHYLAPLSEEKLRGLQEKLSFFKTKSDTVN